MTSTEEARRESMIAARKRVAKVLSEGRGMPAGVLAAQVMLVLDAAGWAVVESPTDEDTAEALRREFEYRIRTAVAYGIGRGKHDDMTSQQKADWIQGEIASAMSSSAARRVSVPPTEDWEYGATHLDPDKPVSIRYTLAEARVVQGFYSVKGVKSNVFRRTKAVPAGPWIPVPTEEKNP